MDKEPNFGYGKHNRVLEREGRSKNWQLMCGVILKDDHTEQLKQHMALRTLGKEHKKVLKVHWDNKRRSNKQMIDSAEAQRRNEIKQVVDDLNDLQK